MRSAECIFFFPPSRTVRVIHKSGTCNTVHELLIDKSHLGGTVQCRMCHLEFPGEKCSRGRGICIAIRDESCMTGTIFRNDGTPWLTFKGCLRNCANVNNIKWSVYLVNFRCCRSHDFCNK
uniref:UPAR/Ly6 domain-containing protein n=1 Tax=Sus scrofa TaxID=9823 RepID=A0A8D1SEY2_PIG